MRIRKAARAAASSGDVSRDTTARCSTGSDRLRKERSCDDTSDGIPDEPACKPACCWAATEGECVEAEASAGCLGLPVRFTLPALLLGERVELGTTSNSATKEKAVLHARLYGDEVS